MALSDRRGGEDDANLTFRILLDPRLHQGFEGVEKRWRRRHDRTVWMLDEVGGGRLIHELNDPE